MDNIGLEKSCLTNLLDLRKNHLGIKFCAAIFGGFAFLVVVLISSLSFLFLDHFSLTRTLLVSKIRLVFLYITYLNQDIVLFCRHLTIFVCRILIFGGVQLIANIFILFALVWIFEDDLLEIFVLEEEQADGQEGGGEANEQARDGGSLKASL